MIKFLIQTFNGKVEHDFALKLIDVKAYHDWSTMGLNIGLYYSDLFDVVGDYIPIGSVEFVHGFMTRNSIPVPPPINIPDDLMVYPIAKRVVINGTESDVDGEKFVKSNTMIKGYREITASPPPGSYQISDIFDIESEWRCFVYDRQLIGMKHYSGDFRIFPELESIYQMIESYIGQPIAYTLDVGNSRLCGNSTVPIEVHNFYSCGLYGFEDRRLPLMFSRWWKEYILKSKKDD